MALVVFAVCLLIGLQAGNTFAETVSRGLKAMVVTLAIGMIVGIMAQKMLEENAKDLTKKLEISDTKPKANDR
jgi:hypothetical protein